MNIKKCFLLAVVCFMPHNCLAQSPGMTLFRAHLAVERGEYQVQDDRPLRDRLSEGHYAAGYKVLGQKIERKPVTMVGVVKLYDAPPALNVQRTAALLPVLKLDPALQLEARETAQVQARLGRVGFHSGHGQKFSSRHLGWKNAGAGMRGGSGPQDVFLKYAATTKYKTAGCASALGTDGRWYYSAYFK